MTMRSALGCLIKKNMLEEIKQRILTAVGNNVAEDLALFDKAGYDK